MASSSSRKVPAWMNMCKKQKTDGGTKPVSSIFHNEQRKTQNLKRKHKEEKRAAASVEFDKMLQHSLPEMLYQGEITYSYHKNDCSYMCEIIELSFSKVLDDDFDIADGHAQNGSLDNPDHDVVRQENLSTAGDIKVVHDDENNTVNNKNVTLPQKNDSVCDHISLKSENLQRKIPNSITDARSSMFIQNNGTSVPKKAENPFDRSLGFMGFDMEWPVSYKPGDQNKTALLQLCIGENGCYLFHLSAMGCLPTALKNLLKNDHILKVGIGIECDLWKLEKDFDIEVLSIIKNSMVDLGSYANTVLNTSENWSLEGLTRHLLGHRISKDPSIRKGNWADFPLSENQKTYAATDAYVSFKLYEKLRSLEKSGL